MPEYKKISVIDIERDAEQPRKDFSEAALLALGQNMKSHGQQVPVIVYCLVGPASETKPYRLLDGERRWRAAQLVGIAELDAAVLPQRPSQTALHILQMSLEAHKSGLTAMERSDLLQRIRTENNWQISELAEKLNMTQPVVSKLLACQKLDGSIQKMLHAGELDIEKAFIISQQSDPAKQHELVKGASALTRDQLRQKAKAVDDTSVRVSTARFPLSNGMTISVQGRDMSLASAVDAMLETVKELKKGQAQGLDITTA